jgi:choline dehydrogenase-like flavoprotein
MDLPSDPVDFLIAGGGSAGCALAARLSEDAAKHMVLAEAGRDVTPANIPPFSAFGRPRHHDDNLARGIGQHDTSDTTPDDAVPFRPTSRHGPCLLFPGV